MKYKKYILILLITLFIGCNRIDADIDKNITGQEDKYKTCYYMSENEKYKIRLTMKWQLVDETKILDWKAEELLERVTLSGYTDVTIDKIDEDNYPYDETHIKNWFGRTFISPCIKNKKVCFGYKYSGALDANGDFRNFKEDACPSYLVFEKRTTQWAVFATESYNDAKTAQNEIEKAGYIGGFVSNTKNGKQITATEYFGEFVKEGLVKYECSENCEPGDEGNCCEVTCADYETIFGDKEKPDSIRYMVNTVLNYIRIIVPILVILLGTIDFAKAVIAGKEDNMRKAQTDFIKRIIIGVAVFFVPVLVDIVMELADIVWAGDYPHCNL